MRVFENRFLLRESTLKHSNIAKKNRLNTVKFFLFYFFCVCVFLKIYFFKRINSKTVLISLKKIRLNTVQFFFFYFFEYACF